MTTITGIGTQIGTGTTASAAPIGISLDEYKGRVARIREEMSQQGVDALILFADSIRVSNVKYVVDFKAIDGYTDIAMAVVTLPLEGDPMLYISQMNLLWGQEVSWFGARPFKELVTGLVDLRRKLDGKGKVGVAGLNFMPVPVFNVIQGAFGMTNVQLVPAEAIMAPIKARKSPTEVALLRKAGEMTVIGLEAIKEAITSGGDKSERDIAAFASAALFQSGGDGPAFDIQIQSGLHASFNNIRSTERLIRPGDSILIEMGANYRGYMTDIARGATVGEVNPRQIEIIKVAADAQQEGCRSLRPGMTAHQLNTIIEQSLVTAGYIEYSAEARGYGTGHGIGTDIEEEEPWIRPGSEFVLEENMVMALKASIFVPGLAGVRIEDEVLVTPNGADILTPYPRVLTW